MKVTPRWKLPPPPLGYYRDGIGEFRCERKMCFQPMPCPEHHAEHVKEAAEREQLKSGTP